VNTTHAKPRNRTRPWAPRGPKRTLESTIDADGMALAELVDLACRRAGTVIAPSLSASAKPVDRADYEERRAIPDRAWRCCTAGREFWWVIDEPSQRRLLACVIGGSPSQSTSAMERTILAETVMRVASPDSSQRRWDEELRARPRGSMWHCDIELMQPTIGTAVLSIFTARAVAPARTGGPIDIWAIPLTINAALPPVRVRLRELLGWRAGTVLALQPSADEIMANLMLSPSTTAGGSLGVAASNRAVRLHRFGTRSRP